MVCEGHEQDRRGVRLGGCTESIGNELGARNGTRSEDIQKRLKETKFILTPRRGRAAAEDAFEECHRNAARLCGRGQQPKKQQWTGASDV